MHILPIALMLFQVLVAPGLALWRGGGPERSMALAFLADSWLTVLVQEEGATRFSRPETMVSLIDLVMLVAAMAITLRANRWWPMWFTACHLIGVLGHLARLAQPAIGTWTYYTVTSFGAYLLWALVIAGTFDHQRRLKNYGIDPDWKSSLPLSVRTMHPAGHP